MATKLNLTVVQGNTFSQVVRWETVPFVFKPITDISRSAPVVITAAAQLDWGTYPRRHQQPA